MGKHTIAEAEGRLAELIDRALQGEEVVITRGDADVVELTPVTPVPPARPLTHEDIDQLVARRVGGMPPEDAATLIRQMRDEEDH